MKATGSPPEPLAARASQAADPAGAAPDRGRAGGALLARPAAQLPAGRLRPARLVPAARLIPAGYEFELAWLALLVICLIAIVRYPQYLVIPFDTIWVTLALLYAFRLWPPPKMLAFLACTAASTAAAIDADLARHFNVDGSLGQLPLLAALFLAVFWQAHSKVATRERAALDAEAERLLASQRQFLQDASHQLRTPITIALGHAELLATELAERQRRDIHMVVGELERLKGLSERLLLVAASENPEFLALEPIWLDELAVDLRRRWAASAGGKLVTGRLDPVLVLADSERLSMALDALVENAVRHTAPDGTITISVSSQPQSGLARIVVADDGEGIADAELPHIFARFRTGSTRTRPGGTGLGLALVQAIARGHGGEVWAFSTLGSGSTFEIVIPAAAATGPASEREQLNAGRARARIPAVHPDPAQLAVAPLALVADRGRRGIRPGGRRRGDDPAAEQRPKVGRPGQLPAGGEL